MKNKLSIHPLLSVASLWVLPAALTAQPSGTTAPPADTTQPGASQPSTPSVPSSPAIPTSPSQPAGMPQPGGAPFPGGTTQPAGTQSSSVGAPGEPTLQFRVMAGVEHESNALRQPSSANSSSDEAAILGVGLKLDKRYALQRLRADVEANTYRYRRQSSLDFSTINYSLAWDWSITPRFHGVLSADRKQYREVSTDPVALVNRVGRRTERAEIAEGIYELGAAWRLMGGVSHTRATSTEPASWDASPSVRSARVGVGYEMASGTSVYARLRRGDGEYTDSTPGASSGDFRENEAEVVVTWPVSGKTSLEGRIGHTERNHEVAPQRDFSGMVGHAAVNWDVTGKTRVTAGVSRDLSATGLAIGGHVQNHRVYVGPVWKATAKIAVNARYDRVSRDWKSVPAGSPEFGRNEVIQMVSAGVDWEPRRFLTVSTYVRNERMKSNLTTGYRSNTIGAVMKVTF